MLHITNGDGAGEPLRRAGLPGDVLPWRDVLHEGPVPAGLSPEELRRVRARFIADRGWERYERVAADFAERDAHLANLGVHEEVVLWFEHDLYDQLQLIQILDRIGRNPHVADRVSLVCIGAHPAVERFLGLGQLQPEHFAALFHERTPLDPAQFELARRAWAAFCAPDPTALQALLVGDCTALPYLAGALSRHLEQFPSTRDGLSRTDHQILEAAVAGIRDPVQLFHAIQDMEEAPFLGDTAFWDHLNELCSGPRPLLRREGEDPGPVAGARALLPTEDAQAVRTGQADWIALRGGIDRWYGGVHLQGPEPEWRWSRDGGHLTRPAGRAQPPVERNV